MEKQIGFWTAYISPKAIPNSISVDMVFHAWNETALFRSIWDEFIVPFYHPEGNTPVSYRVSVLAFFSTRLHPTYLKIYEDQQIAGLPPDIPLGNRQVWVAFMKKRNEPRKCITGYDFIDLYGQIKRDWMPTFPDMLSPDEIDAYFNDEWERVGTTFDRTQITVGLQLHWTVPMLLHGMMQKAALTEHDWPDDAILYLTTEKPHFSESIFRKFEWGAFRSLMEWMFKNVRS